MKIYLFSAVLLLASNFSYGATFFQCEAKLYFNPPRLNGPYEMTKELEPIEASTEHQIKLSANMKMLDAEVNYYAELNLVSENGSIVGGRLEIDFNGEKTNTTDIHHTQIDWDLESRVTLIPPNYGKRHFAELSCEMVEPK